MRNQLRILIYGDPSQTKELTGLLGEAPFLAGRTWDVRFTNDTEDLQQQLVEWDPRVTIVSAPGAGGLEAAYQARATRPCNPVFWFSDDRNFAMQAHRMECMYFSIHPITAEKLNRAFAKCGHMGLRI